MGLHAAIIRLSPLIHEGEQRYKPYIVGDPRMVSLSVTPPLKNPGYAPDSDTFFFCKHYFSRITFMFYIFVFFEGIKWWEWWYMSSWTMHQISTCPYEKVGQGQKELITFQLLVGLTHKTLMSVSLSKGNLGTKRGNSVWFAPTYDLQVRSTVALLINAVNPA